MAQRPKVADVIAWMGVQSDTTDGDGSPLDLVTRTAVLAVEERLNADRLPDGALDDDADNYPETVLTAVLLTASRLYKRRTTPGGQSEFGDFGVVGIVALDPDVERLIERYVKVEGFA